MQLKHSEYAADHCAIATPNHADNIQSITHAASQQDVTYGCLSNKLELLMCSGARQHLLQLGCSEEELKMDLCISVVLLVLLHTGSTDIKTISV